MAGLDPCYPADVLFCSHSLLRRISMGHDLVLHATVIP